MSENPSEHSVVVVTGANGLVGSRVVAALAERGVGVRAVVRRPGTAPSLPGVEERVGDFADAGFAAEVVAGAGAVVTTVHPMTSDLETQRQVGVQGTTTLARAAAEAGVSRLVHISTAAVYDRSPQRGDVDEDALLVGDDASDYPLSKRETEESLTEVAQSTGLTTVLLRPPMIFGPGESSTWNTLRPNAMREDESARHAVPEQTIGWVHVDDLAAITADVATGDIADSDDPGTGPISGASTPLNVAASPATMRDYVAAVTGALGVEPVWDSGPAWTGRIIASRAHRWGWSPQVDLDEALSEVTGGL